MKIAMISEHANPQAVLGGVDAGGQNVHVDALATALVARGHRVTVHTRREDPDQPVRTRCPGGYDVELVTAGPTEPVPKDDLWQWMPEFARQLAIRWRESPVDIAHAHFWMSGAAACGANDLLARKVPVVQTFHALGSVKRRHQGERDTSPPGRIDVERTLCRRVDHIIATCSDELAELVELGADPERVSIVPCGVDIERFAPSAATPAAQLRLLTVARLVERKGIGDVIAALHQLDDAVLTVVGGPTAAALIADPEAQRLAALARRLDCLDRVHFTGGLSRDAMPELFASSDVVVAAPWYEPFGIVPLEAMASGRPVVGTKVGGLLDTVTPGVTGELVPTHRPDLIADAVRRLTPKRREAYGQAGARRARDIYSWPAVAAQTETALRKVIDAAHHRAVTTSGAWTWTPPTPDQPSISTSSQAR
ncbi:glycosyltransferase [Epidermidibacterium keratini]|uniref:Glycosyltransferase n=1 Tax=Epidermidibacterium keratini TaxID=1891644 RepID=A0A7L4YNF8_9ACTN|nr:glycosyltransferase [Epidermidibacterium keratini]QHC00394.1 glycosyltransferase [Epidermidibacterium keratini]